ncbi:nuclear transport factor 2 family protein [Phytopseudomonas dryadis]|nr:nuclear transport factor 2 family protein [Pseudomonas dryadis]
MAANQPQSLATEHEPRESGSECTSDGWKIVSVRLVSREEIDALVPHADNRDIPDRRSEHMPSPTSCRIRAGLVILGVLALLSQSANAADATDAESRNKRIVTEAFDHWASGGTGFFDELLATDVVWTIKGSGPSAGTLRGRDVFLDRAVHPFASRLSTPVRPVNRQVWADGEHVIVHWDGEGMARDGVAYRNSYAWILRMRSGKAAEVTAFLDLTPYDDVLRRIPAPAANGEHP